MRPVNRYPNNLSQEDRKTYRRWMGGLFLSYGFVIAIAIGMIYFNQPSGDLRAANETRMAGLKSTSTSAANATSPTSIRP